MAEPNGSHGPVTGAVPVRLRDRFDPRPGLWRVRESALPIVQLVIAVTASWSFAFFVLGHTAPLLAVTVTVSSLGLARDARPRTLVETLAGMILGILLAEGVLALCGQGWWQIALTGFIVLMVARFVSSKISFAVAATIQGLIVMIIPAAVSSPLSRLVDALVAAVVAILVTVLVPRTLSRETARDARAVFAAADAAIHAIAQGLRAGDRMRADRGLEKARALDGLLGHWRVKLESAAAVARISPWLRRRRAEVERHRRVLAAMDLVLRNLRVVARRAAYLAADGEQRRVPADLLHSLGRGLVLVGESLDDLTLEPAARETIAAIAAHLDPADVDPGGTAADHNLIAAMRPLAVDLLVAAGMPRDEARSRLPRR